MEEVRRVRRDERAVEEEGMPRRRGLWGLWGRGRDSMFLWCLARGVVASAARGEGTLCCLHHSPTPCRSFSPVARFLKNFREWSRLCDHSRHIIQGVKKVGARTSYEIRAPTCCPPLSQERSEAVFRELNSRDDAQAEKRGNASRPA